MNKAHRLLSVLALQPLLGFAQSPFDGTWRPDPEKPGPQHKPDVVELIHGVYECQSCTPPYKVNADGRDHPLKGNPYYDSVSISVIDDRTVMKTAKMKGTMVAETRIAVSPDGQSQIEQQTFRSMGPRPIEMTAHFARIAAGSAGSHAIS